MDRPRSHLLIGLLFGAWLAFWLAGAAMIQTAQSSAHGSTFWCDLGVGLMGLGTLALLSLLAVVGPIAKRLPWGKPQDRGVLGPPETPDPCGDSEERLDLLFVGATQLANILKNFENWWPAVKDEGYEDKLPDGTSTVTHAEAMQTLIFAFAQFFSAAWTYEDHCPKEWHRRKDVRKYVVEVYKALGKRPIGPIDDETIRSEQLHAIGELSTEGWRTAEARPIGTVAFKVKTENDPHLAEALRPLREFLRAANPGTEAHARVEAAEKSVKRVKESVEESLAEKDYQP